MATRTWNFDIHGRPHEVRLKFSLFPGRQIWLDGVLINKGRKLFEAGSEYHFDVDGRPAELGIVSTPAGYEFYLRVSEEFIFPKNEKRNKMGKYTTIKFSQRQVWIDNGNKYSLQYHPFSVKPSIYQHRLIGYLDDFLVVIAPGFKRIGDNSIPGCYLLVRHISIDSDKVREIKNNQDVRKVLKEIKSGLEWLDIEPTFTSIFAASKFKKVSETELIERLLSVFHIISKSLQPTQANKCEGSDCSSPYFKDLTLTLINGVPQLLCQDCIGRTGNIGKRTEEEYKKQPSNIGKGIVYGLAAAFLGALAWALIFIFLERIGAVFAILIFFLVVKAMDYAKTKRTFLSLLIAGLLSLAGSIAGSYFGLAGYLFKEGKFEPTMAEFIELAKSMIEKPNLLNDTILFAMIGLVPYMFLTWNASRSQLKQVFKPRIEIISNFQLK